MYNLYVLILFSLLFHTKLYSALVLDDKTEECEILKDNLAANIANFTQCTINYSRPITMCENCLDGYIDLLTSYKNMSEVFLNETKCLDYYINLDRLQILDIQYSNSVNLWQRAKCYECYLIIETQSAEETETSKQFRSYYNKFETCINNTNAETLCHSCMENYQILSDYYESISNTNERIGICIDLEDQMNSTWNYWSSNCCKYRKHNEYVFIGSTIGVFLITIFLYVIVQFFGEKKAPTIIQQSRFAESINRFYN